MPRRKLWQPREMGPAAQAIYESFQAAAPSVDASLRAISDLKLFVEANRAQVRTLNREAIYGLAASQMREDGLLPSSIEGVLRHWTTWHVDPFNTDAAAIRIRARQALSGLERISAKVGVTFVKALHSRETLLTILMGQGAGKTGDPLYKLLWLAALVTGNRMKHFRDARSLTWDKIGLWVVWGPRKIRTESATSPILYRYEWTGVFPDTQTVLLARALDCKPPCIATPESIAGCMDAWLRDRVSADQRSAGVHITTGCARVFGLQAIARLVARRTISRDDFEMLVDQTCKTFLNRTEISRNSFYSSPSRIKNKKEEVDT
jgi:hypothetical protein